MTERFGATVIDAGGGQVGLLIDRDAERYPSVGDHVQVMVTVGDTVTSKPERPVSGSRLIDWLTLNGLISPSDTLVSRVLIDIKSNSAVKVYVERYGSERMLEVVPPHLEPTQIVEVDRPACPYPNGKCVCTNGIGCRNVPRSEW